MSLYALVGREPCIDHVHGGLLRKRLDNDFGFSISITRGRLGLRTILTHFTIEKLRCRLQVRYRGHNQCAAAADVRQRPASLLPFLDSPLNCRYRTFRYLHSAVRTQVPFHGVARSLPVRENFYNPRCKTGPTRLLSRKLYAYVRPFRPPTLILVFTFGASWLAAFIGSYIHIRQKGR